MSRKKTICAKICASSNKNKIKTYININKLKHNLGKLPGQFKLFKKIK